MLPHFVHHSGCRACSFCHHGKSVGLPARPAVSTTGNRSRAVLVVGKAPAIDEDENGRIFSGPTGQLLERVYVEGLDLQNYADFYLTNIVRCRPTNVVLAIPLSAQRACMPHMQEDLDLLHSIYDEVVLLAIGAEALQYFSGRVVSFGRFHQGTKVEFGKRTYTLFATYLPTNLLPGRDPNLATAVHNHLMMLRQYLVHGELPHEIVLETDLVLRRRNFTPPADVELFALDIETYGAVDDQPAQRFFHPAKSMSLDHVNREDLVVSAAVAWRDDAGCQYACWLFPDDMHSFLTWLFGLPSGTVLLGQNFVFDLTYLRAWMPGLQAVLAPYGRVIARELAVSNFLECDVRPERSLKTLSPLLQTAVYEDHENLSAGQRFKRDDPRLLVYNVRDALATLRNYEILEGRLPLKYGSRSARLSTARHDWFNDLIWLVVRMTEAGVPFDRQAIQRLHDQTTRRIDRLSRWTQNRLGFTLSGKGSKKCMNAFAEEAVRELDLESHPELELSEATAIISGGAHNLWLFYTHSKKGTRVHSIVRLVQKHRELSGLVDRYTTPMLGLDEKRLNMAMLADDRVYPTWWLVPSTGDDSEGGTKQGRITAKGPAIQTIMPAIEACIRQDGHYIVSIDESQIELRVPALYSGDPAMVNDFLAGRNRHTETASLIFDRQINKKVDKAEYALGKTVNFLMAFRGQWKKLQETAKRDIGLDLTEERCRQIIDQFRARHPTFTAWQEELVERACRDGFLEVPVIGLSRTFIGLPEVIRRTYTPTIVNFPVQTTAALLTLSAQVAVDQACLNSSLRTRLLYNTYDEGVYQVPVDELDRFLMIAEPLYKNPPLLRAFRVGGHFSAASVNVPLDCSVTIDRIAKHEHPTQTRRGQTGDLPRQA